MDLDFGCISLEGACGFPCPHSFVFFYRSEMRQGNGDKGMKGDGGVALGEDRSRSATTLLRNRNSARLGCGGKRGRELSWGWGGVGWGFL
jgi:hypothetical protein